MTNDFHLFGDDADPSLDADVALVAAYVARELSPVQILAMEERLGGDPAFRTTMQSVIDGWVVRGDGSTQTERRPSSTTLTAEEIEAGWQRYLVAPRPASSMSRPAHRTEAEAQPARPRWTERRLVRIAAVIAIVVIPLVTIAQLFTLMSRDRDAGRSAPGAPSPGDVGGQETAPPRPIRLDEGPASRTLPLPDARPPVVGRQSVALSVHPVPVFDVGLPGTPLNGRVAVGMVRLADGRIVIAGNNTIRFLDANGRQLQTIEGAAIGPSTVKAQSQMDSSGRRFALNTGPGRVGGPFLPYRGDSMVITTGRGGGSTTVRSLSSARIVDYMDYTYNDAIVVDATGRPGRSVHIEASVIGPPRANTVLDTRNNGLQGTLDDGSFVVGGPVADIVPSRRITYYRVSPDGATQDTIVTVTLPPAGLVLFGPQAPLAVARGRHLYWSEGSRFEVTAFDLSARPPGTPIPTRVMRSPRQPEPVTDALRSYIIERSVARAAEIGRDSAAERARLRALPTHPVQPAVAAILVDERGTVWLEHFRATMARPGIAADTADVPRYTVFDASGLQLGEVTMPRGFTVHAVGPDWVLGTVLGKDNVERVRMHRLVK